jgi:hypothetical protein
MGVSDARKEMASNSSLETLLKQGPVYHHLNGYIKSIMYEADFEFGPDQSITSVIGKGTWIGSYEAEEHVKRISISDTPVCHINVGYLNGYLSTVCEHPVIAKEISCVGKGDSQCEWILKSQDCWEEDIQESCNTIIKHRSSRNWNLHMNNCLNSVVVFRKYRMFIKG